MAFDNELLVARGNSLADPIRASHFRKAPAPSTGDRFGTWGPDGMYYARLPGGSVLTFDLSKLTLQDYRQMRDDYQLSASLLILMFIVAQADWTIECEDQNIADVIETGLRKVWFPLIRSLSTADWCGFAPTVKVFDLDKNSKYYEIKEFKDLIPEMSRVHWNITKPNGSMGASIYKFDGIDFGGEPTIPAENCFWYPMLMENGNMYGRKLLRPAFPAWFFSQLIHLFTNRYFERFGEPTAVGTYPADEEVTTSSGQTISGRAMMEQTLAGLRSRGTVSMPSEKDEKGNPLWDIKYLESQMRGVDFDRYIERLDEEKSLALFTPVLLFRTGSKGSYNLGDMHMQVFQYMLNALVGDKKHYIDKHIIKQLKDINFGPNAPEAQIRFRVLGRLGDDGAVTILQALLQNGAAQLNQQGLQDLGAYLGLGVQEIAQLQGQEPTQPDPAQPGGDPRIHPGVKTQRTAALLSPPKPPAGNPNPNPAGRTVPSPRTALHSARERLVGQVEKAFAKGNPDFSNVKVGYKGAFVNAMMAEGTDQQVVEQFFSGLQADVLDALAEPKDLETSLNALNNAFSEYGIEPDSDPHLEDS
ncbi:MAG: hypothetical protein M3O41_14265 [Pseudomonadota bacterium]|nr:hypothetical protein [Pseudomonadota bacterium]